MKFLNLAFENCIKISSSELFFFINKHLKNKHLKTKQHYYKQKTISDIVIKNIKFFFLK